jgi:hypothetical protein
MLKTRHGPKFLRSIHQIGGEFLPLYQPNENYVEYNDGFYEISTEKLLRELDEDIVCFCYFLLSFEYNVNVCPPKRWHSILERIGILDEFSRNQLSREDFLLLAEGQPMKISMKYQKNPRMNKVLCKILRNAICGVA